MSTIREKIYRIVSGERGASRANRLFEALVTLLVLVSVGAVFASTFEVSAATARALLLCERAASVVFTFEYAARIWTADLERPGLSPLRARWRYLRSFMAIVDLVSILPFWLPMLLPHHLLGLRVLRLLWLFRVFKLNRYFTAMATLGEVVREKRRELVSSVYAILILTLVASLMIYVFEHDAQPEAFRNAFSGLYWAVVTLTSVGYGDLAPVTVPGRILGGVLALLGIAAVAIPTGIISSGLTELLARRRNGGNRRRHGKGAKRG